MESYDFSQLKPGDPVIYGGYHHAWSGLRVTKTKIERFTATQIVMENGTRFRRDNGVKVGDFSIRLLDPKGKAAQKAAERLEVSTFAYGLDKWDQKRREIDSLDAWEIHLAQLEALVADAQRRVREMKEERA